MESQQSRTPVSFEFSGSTTGRRRSHYTTTTDASCKSRDTDDRFDTYIADADCTASDEL
jgi:hypothetical protein